MPCMDGELFFPLLWTTKINVMKCALFTNKSDFLNIDYLIVEPIKP